MLELNGDQMMCNVCNLSDRTRHTLSLIRVTSWRSLGKAIHVTRGVDTQIDTRTIVHADLQGGPLSDDSGCRLAAPEIHPSVYSTDASNDWSTDKVAGTESKAHGNGRY